MPHPRHPTIQDFLDNRTFCVVSVEADDQQLKASVKSRALRITHDSNGALRLNPYGVLDTIELGAFQPRSYSAYAQSGVFIGYTEDEAELLRAAQGHLEQVRTAYLKGLRLQAQLFEALAVHIEAPV